MGNPRLWNVLGLVVLLLAVGLYAGGANLARERTATLRVLKHFDEWCGPFVQRAIFSSYFGRPNTSQDIEHAHKLTAECQQAVLLWMRDDGLSNNAREALLKRAISVFDSELARRVENNQVLPTKLSDAGYRYPAQGNPFGSISLALLIAAMGAFGHAAGCRHGQRARAQSRMSNEPKESEEVRTINLDIFEDEKNVRYARSVEDVEDAEDFADEDDYEDEQPDEHLLERDRRLESVERELHRLGLQQAQREKKVERERLDAQRREERARREQAGLMERDRNRREADERLQRQKDREREEREQAARKRADENLRREQERKDREKERREKADYERREREVEIVYNLKAGGFEVVPGGSAFGAQMTAENRLRNSQNVRSYVIRNKNGKVIGSG